MTDGLTPPVVEVGADFDWAGPQYNIMSASGSLPGTVPESPDTKQIRSPPGPAGTPNGDLSNLHALVLADTPSPSPLTPSLLNHITITERANRCPTFGIATY